MATLSAIHNNEPTPNASKETHMKAARMHEYGKPPVLEDVPVPEIRPDEILVNVKACGMCRSDVQLVDGYFRKYADIPTPITMGHEITGVVHKVGGVVPKASTPSSTRSSLGSGAKAVAFGRNADKLNLAKRYGA